MLAALYVEDESDTISTLTPLRKIVESFVLHLDVQVTIIITNSFCSFIPRMVGTYNADKEQMLCLTIRPVQDGELDIAQLCAEKSAEVITKLTRGQREQ